MFFLPLKLSFTANLPTAFYLRRYRIGYIGLYAVFSYDDPAMTMNSSNNQIAKILLIGMTLLIGGIGFRLVYKPKPGTTLPTSADAAAAAKLKFTILVANIKANPKDPATHVALGEFFAAAKVPKKAAIEFGIALKLSPKDIKIKLRLGDMFLAAKEFVGAETVYHEISVSDPKNLEAWQGLTAVLDKEGRYYEAMHVVRKALALDPDNPNTHLLMAKSALEYAVQFPNPENHAGELDFAKNEFVGLAKALPDSAEVHYHLGRAYVGLHDKKNGVAALWKAHQLQPGNQEMGQMLVIVLRAMNDMPNALKVTTELLKVDPDNAPTNDLYGQTILQTKDPDRNKKAVEAFARAVKKSPKNPIMLQHLGDALILVNDLQGARTTFEKAVAADNTMPYSYQRLAMVYTRLGDRVQAKKASTFGTKMEANDMLLRRLQDLSQKHPEDIKLHTVLAKRYQDLRRPGPARDEYLAILKLDPNNKDVPTAIKKAAAAYQQGQ